MRPPATLLATRFYATRTAFLCQRAKPATLFLLLLCHTFSLALNALGAFCSLIICAMLFARPRSIHHTHKPSHPSMPRVFLFLFSRPRAKPFKRHTHRIFLLRTLVRLFLCHLPRKMRLPRIFCVRLPHSQPTHAFFVCASPPHSHLHFFMPHTLFFCANALNPPRVFCLLACATFSATHFYALH